MSPSNENQSEILLGNKQLLAIFFVIAILLGVAFTGGYMLGRGSSEKKPLVVAAAPSDASSTPAHESGLETHPVGPGSETSEDTSTAARPDSRTAAKRRHETETAEGQTQASMPLGSSKSKINAKATRQPEPPVESNVEESYAPQTGQTFLQVVALSRDDAYGVAQVLTQKGFRAHSVPKPGSPKLYRVLVGPIRDTSDLSATRDALRKNAGFQDVIVQRY